MEAAKYAAVSAAVGKSESWAQKVADGDSGVLLDDIPKLLAALGLKVVDLREVVVDPDVFRSFKAIAGKALTDPAALSVKEGAE